MTIDQKNYAAVINVKASHLAQSHLDALVTVTLPSGAQVTDVLTGVLSGNFASVELNERVQVMLANVSNESLRFNRRGGFELDASSVVKVRRPKAKPPTKRSTR